jgi:tetratricopeptide (TPR) repeat protein
LYRDCLQARERVLSTNHNDTLITLGNLGNLFLQSGSLEKAEPILREVVKRREHTALNDSIDAFANVNNLALVLLVQDRWDDAEQLLDQTRRRAATKFGPEDVVCTLRLQQALARVYAAQRRFDDAEALAAPALVILRRIAPNYEVTGRTLLILGRVKFEKGNLDDAEPLLREAWTLFRERYPMQRELTAQAANWLGAVHVARHTYPEAEGFLLADPEQFFAPTAQMSVTERRAAVGHIIQLYEGWGKPERAASWREKLEEFGQSTHR